MAGLKAWLQDAVAALCVADVHLLAETLRIDRRGCEDRHELARVIVNLVGLDHDSALGRFLAWFHTERGVQSPSPLTFFPARVPTSSHHAASLDDACHTVLQTHLNEVHELETAVKAAERRVHTGAPGFQNLQQFFGHLTAVRDAEARTRGVLVRQVEQLETQCQELDATCVHLRAQVAFFVEGFTNLRRRHDALLTRAIRWIAESESAQAVWMAMSGHDGAWAHVLATTLRQEGQRTADVTRRLLYAEQAVEHARVQQRALATRVEELHRARQAAVVKTCCSKWQLESWKKRNRRLDAVRKLEVAARHDKRGLQRVLASLLDGFYEAVERDGALSREYTPRHELLRRLLPVVQGCWKDKGIEWLQERFAMYTEDVAMRIQAEEREAGLVAAVRAGGDAKTKKTRVLSTPKLLKRSKLRPKSMLVKGRKS